MNLLNEPAIHLPVAKAEAVAAELQAGDPDWSYRLSNPDGPLTKVAIYDEEDFLLGYVSANMVI